MGKVLEIEKQHTLVSAIRNNDQQVLKKLYLNNYQKVEKYILANSGSIPQAKDAYQEAFLATYQNVKADKFLPLNETALQGYLFTIAKNKWTDYLRSAQFKKTKGISENLSGSLSENADENIEDDFQLKMDSTLDAFSKLGEECKNVLTLFYFNKKSMREIAEIQNLEEASVRNKKYRCLQQLKKLAFKESEN